MYPDRRELIKSPLKSYAIEERADHFTKDAYVTEQEKISQYPE